MRILTDIKAYTHESSCNPRARDGHDWYHLDSYGHGVGQFRVHGNFKDGAMTLRYDAVGFLNGFCRIKGFS